MRCALVVTACALACSQPPKQERPKRAKPQLLEGSPDRSNPLRLAFDYHKGNVDGLSVTTRAPRAGTWWYVLDVPERPGTLTTLGVSVSGPDDGYAFAWVDELQKVHPATKVSAGYSEIDFPETSTPPRTVVLQVTTTVAATLSLAASRRHREVPILSAPPCDPDNIDPANPHCEGFHPRCDANKPDFKLNPRCCEARTCSYGRLTCRAKLVQYDPKHVTSATISLGAKDEIVAFARGRLYQWVDRQERKVSDVYVRSVGETESWILIESPDKVDPTKLADSWVILTAPEPCNQRRP